MSAESKWCCSELNSHGGAHDESSLPAEEQGKRDAYEKEDRPKDTQKDGKHHHVRGSLEVKLVPNGEELSSNDAEEEATIPKDAADGEAEDNRK